MLKTINVELKAILDGGRYPKGSSAADREPAASALAKPVVPFTPDGAAMCPTEFTRVSVFGLPREGRREFYDWEELAGRIDVANVRVQYHGWQLDQRDMDLWLAALYLARGRPFTEPVWTSRRAVLCLLDKGDDARTYRWLRSSLDRLSTAALKVEMTRRDGRHITVRCGLLKAGEDERGLLYLRLDPDAAALFENQAYIGWAERLGARSNVTKALHVYVCGHVPGQQHSVQLESLKAWLGFAGRTRQFRAGVLRALADLERIQVIATGWKVSDRGVASWIRKPRVAP